MRTILSVGLAFVLSVTIPFGLVSAEASLVPGRGPAEITLRSAGSPFSFVDSSSGLSSMQWEGGPTEVKIVDWDLDGNPDILSVGDHGNPRINSAEDGLMRYLGDGQGGWSLKQGGGFGYGGVGIGDLNQDGVQDVVVGTHHNYPSAGCGRLMIDVCLGPNLQTWNSGLQTAGEDYGMFNSEVGDFDNDGWLDVTSNTFGTPNNGAGTVIYRNNHDGTWKNSFKTPAGVSALTLAVADFDADGCLDMISPNDGGTLFRGDCKGSQARAESGLPVFNNGVGPRGASFGDLDNDGTLELAFTQYFQGVGGYVYMPFLYRWDGVAWKNDSASIWTLFDLSDLNSTWSTTQMGDADMDGNIDILVAGRQGFTILQGDGAGKFTRDYDYDFTDPDARGWTAFRFGADADHNGYPDVAGVVSIQGSSYKYHSEPHFFKNLATGGLTGSLVFPRGGEKFHPGSARFIEWTAAGTAPAKIEISTSGSGGPWTIVKDAAPNSGRFQWTVPASPSKNCYIKVTSGASSTTSGRPFEIIGSSGPAPLVAQVVAPNGGEVLNAGQSFDISFTLSGGSMPATGTLELSTAGPSGPWSKIADLSNLPAGVGMSAWTVPTTPTTTAFVRLAVKDSSPTPQSASDPSNLAFTIAVPPGATLERVELTPATSNLAVGQKARFTAAAFDTGGNALSAAAFAWTLIGTIGTLTPAGPQADVSATTPGFGSVEVTASHDGVSRTATAAVEVTARPVPQLAKVTVTPSSISGNVGAAVKLTAVAYDVAGDEMTGATFRWTVSGSFATLNSSDGDQVMLTLVDAGTGTVQVTATKDGKEATAKASINVKRPFVFPWELLMMIILLIAAVIAAAGIAGWWRRKKREEQRQTRAWQQWQHEQAQHAREQAQAAGWY